MTTAIRRIAAIMPLLLGAISAAGQSGTYVASPTNLSGNIIVIGSSGGSSPITFSQSGNQLTISTSIPGDSIFYTTDGSTANIASTLYTGPFTVTAGEVISAAAARAPLIEQNVQASTTNSKCTNVNGGTSNGITCESGGGVGTIQPSSWNWTFGNPSVETLSTTANSSETQQLYQWQIHSTTCDGACTVVAEDKIIEPSQGATYIANNEIDAYLFDNALGIEVMMGLQCDQQSGSDQWQIDSGDGTGWHDTGITTGCPLSTTSATHVLATATRDIGGTGCTGGRGCLHYQNLCVNGICTNLNTNLGLESLPSGWTSLVGIQDQIDLTNTTASGHNPTTAARSVWHNNVSAGYVPDAFAAYIASSAGTLTPPTFAPSSPYSGTSTSLTLSAASGAGILYCTDTTNSCAPAVTYSSPLPISSSGYVRAQATEPGYTSSPIASWQGTISGVPSVNDVYLAQSATGSANGSSCANALAYSWFNSSSHWTSGTPSGTTIGPGTTVHVCGTIAVASGAEAFVFQGSGTNGNPVTLYFESGAAIESPSFAGSGSGGGIDIGSYSYLTIDGNGGVGGATEGLIENTLTGDIGGSCPGGPCTSNGDTNGIFGAGGNSNITIKGLTIADMYVTVGNPNFGGNIGAQCIYDHGQMNNWTISGNTMHDASWCINQQWDSGANSNFTIANNTIYNIDHAIAMGGSTAHAATLTGVYVYGNNIHDYSNWDTTTDAWHHDGIHLWGDPGDDGSNAVSNVNVYNNQFGGCIGQNVTGHIFIEANAGATTSVSVYNNTLIDSCSGNDNSGLLTIGGTDGPYLIANNTFLGASTDNTCAGLSNAANVTFENNVVSGCNQLMYVTTGGSFASGGLRNNIYASCAGEGGGGNCWVYNGSYYGSLSSWQSATGQDASPSQYFSSAGLSPSGTPQTGSPVIAAGFNLTSLGIAALNSDLNGTPRPVSGAWDVGALNY